VALHKGSIAMRLYEANPMAVFARCFRSVLYELAWPTFAQIAYLAGVTAITLAVGLWAFAKLSPRFAEEF
jgi:ABC-type polysaccharide/polyol phosphate export permease